jgi:hypothetical protein
MHSRWLISKICGDNARATQPRQKLVHIVTFDFKIERNKRAQRNKLMWEYPSPRPRACLPRFRIAVLVTVPRGGTQAAALSIAATSCCRVADLSIGGLPGSRSPTPLPEQTSKRAPNENEKGKFKKKTMVTQSVRPRVRQTVWKKTHHGALRFGDEDNIERLKKWLCTNCQTASCLLGKVLF